MRHAQGKFMKCVSVCVLAAAAALLQGPARAQDDEPPKPAMPPFGMPVVVAPPAAHAKPEPRPGMFAAASALNVKRLTLEQREERRFLKDAAAASRFEMDAARMALAKSGNAQVRSFAATLINHHTGTAPVLQRMLHIRGMAAPMLANDQRKTLNRLTRINGAKFDREFLDEVGLKYQLEGVQMYEKALLVTKDPALRAWIEKTLSTLKYHLSTAERAANREVTVAKGKTPAVPPARQASATTARQVIATQPAKQAAAQQPQAGSLFAPPPLATQFMGAGPFQLGQPVAARPTESNSR
jgi:predicted outer membrane protein